jgi:nicotinamidase-related amidase
MKPATLCVIDVQVPFHAAGRKSLLDNIVRLVKNAKRRKAGIVLVEFEGFGSTHIAIQQAIGSYERCITTIKSDCDGSGEIIDACRRKGFYTGKIIVCGVETNNCVLATIDGLDDLLPFSKKEVVASACNAHKHNNSVSEKAFKKMLRYGNVKIRRR